jgi:hypothetical protein
LKHLELKIEEEKDFQLALKQLSSSKGIPLMTVERVDTSPIPSPIPCTSPKLAETVRQLLDIPDNAARDIELRKSSASKVIVPDEPIINESISPMK